MGPAAVNDWKRIQTCERSQKKKNKKVEEVEEVEEEEEVEEKKMGRTKKKRNVDAAAPIQLRALH